MPIIIALLTGYLLQSSGKPSDDLDLAAELTVISPPPPPPAPAQAKQANLQT